MIKVRVSRRAYGGRGSSRRNVEFRRVNPTVNVRTFKDRVRRATHLRRPIRGIRSSARHRGDCQRPTFAFRRRQGGGNPLGVIRLGRRRRRVCQRNGSHSALPPRPGRRSRCQHFRGRPHRFVVSKSSPQNDARRTVAHFSGVRYGGSGRYRDARCPRGCLGDFLVRDSLFVQDGSGRGSRRAGHFPQVVIFSYGGRYFLLEELDDESAGVWSFRRKMGFVPP